MSNTIGETLHIGLELAIELPSVCTLFSPVLLNLKCSRRLRILLMHLPMDVVQASSPAARD